MKQNPDQQTRNRFLLTNLAILVIFIMSLLVVISAYPLIFAPDLRGSLIIDLTKTQTPTITNTPTITLTPTATRTLRPTFSPTITQTPSRTLTATATPTPPGPPTLTPARPYPGENIYDLYDWTPERADHMGALLEDYPNTLTREERGPDNTNYYSAYQYAAIAYQEAILRFPDAPQAKQWQWNLAYDLARMGDVEAGHQYAQIIATALNQDEIALEEVVTWFNEFEPRLMIERIKLTPLPGALSTSIVHISGAGSASFALIEKHGSFQFRTLHSAFDFVNKPEFRIVSGDLNLDGIEEVIIYESTATSDLVLPAPLVYDLVPDPASILDFKQSKSDMYIGTDYEAEWVVIPSQDDLNRLRFSTRVFPSCPVTIMRDFEWITESLELVRSSYQVDPNLAELRYCIAVADHAVSAWGMEAAIEIMEKLLPTWPPKTDIYGDKTPSDAIDEWYYRLGIYHALIGNHDEAQGYLQKVVDTPTTPTSNWIEPAVNFLTAYQLDTDLYKACIISPLCDAKLAIKHLIESQPPATFSDILSFLWDNGVSQRASGYFDFDLDDRREIWLSVRHRPGEQLEYWIIVPYPAGLKAFYISQVDTNKPEIVFYDQETRPPIVLIDGQVPFQVGRLDNTLEPFLLWPLLPQFYPDHFKDALDDIVDRLFDGENPATIRRELMDLEHNPGLLCTPTWTCDLYLYILGLVDELLGVKINAIETYLRLWWDYSISPYTTMARLKLEGVGIPPTPTITPTRTATTSPYPTSTALGTQATYTPISTSTYTAPTLTPMITATNNEPYPGSTIYPTITPYDPYPTPQ